MFSAAEIDLKPLLVNDTSKWDGRGKKLSWTNLRHYNIVWPEAVKTSNV